MKKVFVLIAVAIVSMSAMAQVQYGAKVGFDMTHFWGKDVGHDLVPNYQLGLMMEYKFNPSFAIAPEVVFAAQGGKESEDGAKVTYHTNYINVPVMLKFYATPSFSIDFGPQVGFNVYSKATAAYSGYKATLDIKEMTNLVDFGVGLGCTYNLTNNAFVQARYNLGLTKAFKGGSETFDYEGYDIELSGDSPDVKNGNIQIAFGMKF